ncbi:hypothetical protein ACVW0I_004691 [Bradyrhizobium sp. LM6.11]
MTIPRDERPRTRNDLAWSISVGGIGIVLFAAMLVFSWYFATTPAPDLHRHAARRWPQRADQRAWAARSPAPCGPARDRLHRAGRNARGCRLSRRRYHCRSGFGAEQDHQVADHERKVLPRQPWHRHQRVRSRQCRTRRPYRRRPDARPQFRPAWIAERCRRARLERRGDRQPDLQAAARHDQRRRQHLHRAVSWARLRRPAQRLSRRLVYFLHRRSIALAWP